MITHLKHFFFLINILSFSLACSSNEYSDYYNEQLEFENDRNEVFYKLENEVNQNINFNEFEKANKQIRILKNSFHDVRFKFRINELKSKYDDRKLFIKIYSTQNLGYIKVYQNNRYFYRYSEKVNEIKNRIDERLYNDALQINTIEALNLFIQKNPTSKFKFDAIDQVSILNEKRIKDSIQSELDYVQAMNEYNRIHKMDRVDPLTFYDYYTLPVKSTNNDKQEKLNYENPNASKPIVNVKGYYKSNGTYVAPHVRTAPNKTKTDNLRYR